tara:strand:+ start:674 stop:1009 length:336 start_codon:yes stop_codon:yes gene_type:complete
MPSRRSSDRSSNDYFDLMEFPHPSHDQMVINGLDKIAKKTGLNGEKLDKIIEIMEKEIKHTKPKPTMFNIGRLTASRKAPVTPVSLTTAQGKTKKKRRKPKKKKRKSTRKK